MSKEAVRTIWMLCALLVGLAMWPACGGAKADALVGKVSAVSGEVTVRRGGGAPAPVHVGQDVARDMTFATGPGASLEVTFENGYVWSLGERRERAVASLRVVDLPKVTPGTRVEDGEVDRSSAAGRHAEPSAADSAGTAMPGKDEAAMTEAAKSEHEKELVRRQLEAEATRRAAEAQQRQQAEAQQQRQEKEPSGGGGVKSGGGRAAFKACPPDDPLCDDDTAATPAAPDLATLRAWIRRAGEACHAEHAWKGRLSVRVQLDATGAVVDATARGDKGSQATAACVASAARKLRGPALPEAQRLVIVEIEVGGAP